MQDWLQEPIVRLVIGLLGSSIVAWAAWRKQSLSGTGSLAAIGVGTVTVAAGGVPWFGIMLVFFITSSLLTRWKLGSKSDAASAYAKGGRRDAGQVLANGGVAALLCTWTLLPGFDTSLLYTGYAGALAAATADTWATEIGGLSRKQPFHILTGKRVPAGTSGGITLLGSAGAVGGAFVIGISAILLGGTNTPLSFLFIIVAAGIAGVIADSIVGAAWQCMYRCENCERLVESKVHCGRPAVLARGRPWLNNDMVNSLCTAAGACIGLLLAAI